jgi:opacity protein-like surface antigen
LGVEGGYGWNVGDSVLLGVEGYVDSNQQAAHAPAGQQYGSNVYGLGLKIGVPLDSLMPYARLGYDHTQGNGAISGFSAGSANSGLGLMYKFAPSWSVEGEWSTASPAASGLKLKTNNFNFGLNYHFDTPAGAAPKDKK